MKTQQKRSEALLQYPPFTLTRRSIASDSHPERNEDSLIADQRRGLVAVFDGVGGSIAGEIASHIIAIVQPHTRDTSVHRAK